MFQWRNFCAAINQKMEGIKVETGGFVILLLTQKIPFQHDLPQKVPLVLLKVKSQFVKQLIVSYGTSQITQAKEKEQNLTLSRAPECWSPNMKICQTIGRSGQPGNG